MKVDFYGKMRLQHLEIVEEIKDLMTEHKKAAVDLAGSEASHAFIIGVPEFDADLDYMEAEVMAVYLEDGKVKFDINWDMDSEEYLEQYPNENDDIGDLYAVVDANDFERLLPCAGMNTVYDAVWEYLEFGYKGDNDRDFEDS